MVQEFLLARKIDLVWGSHKIPWDVVSTSLQWLERTHKIFGTAMESSIFEAMLSSVPFHYLEQRSTKETASLSKLLVRYERTRCANPGDKVYAMLGLASDCNEQLDLIADYNQDVEDLFWDVLHFCTDVAPEDKIQFVNTL